MRIERLNSQLHAELASKRRARREIAGQHARNSGLRHPILLRDLLLAEAQHTHPLSQRAPNSERIIGHRLNNMRSVLLVYAYINIHDELGASGTQGP